MARILNHFITFPSAGTPGVVSLQTVNDNQTAEETKGGGNIAPGNTGIGSSDLELNYDASTQSLWSYVGVQFPIDIPLGANVTNAYVQFQADESDSSTMPNLTIYGESSVNSAPFSAGVSSFNISNRTPTASNVTWGGIPSWTTGQRGVDQRTPNLESIINEIISLPGYSGAVSPITLVFNGDPNNGSTAQRVAESRGSGAPELVVEYLL